MHRRWPELEYKLVGMRIVKRSASFSAPVGTGRVMAGCVRADKAPARERTIRHSLSAFAQVEAVIMDCALEMEQVRTYQLVRSAGRYLSAERALAPHCCAAVVALFICLHCLAGAVNELMGKLCTRAYCQPLMQPDKQSVQMFKRRFRGHFDVCCEVRMAPVMRCCLN